MERHRTILRAGAACVIAAALVACGAGTISGSTSSGPLPGGAATTSAQPPSAPTVSPPPGSSAAPVSTPSPAQGSTAASTAGSCTIQPFAPAIAPNPTIPFTNGEPFAPTPDPDPFYAQPNPFPSVAPGTILTSRQVTFDPYLETAVPMSNSAWELKFASRDVNCNPIAAVATVVLPTLSGATPALVSYQIAEDGLGAACAPSHTLTGGSADGAVDPGLLLMLSQGWTIVVPDHEGPLGGYNVGKLAGQIVLDGIRAAEHFSPDRVTAKMPVGMYGYSGGALATAWADSLAPSYAPDLSITGVASGGTPASPIAVAENADSNTLDNLAAFALVFSSMLGVNRAYPQFFSPIFNSAGVAVGIAQANGCAGATTNGAAKPSGQIADYTTTINPFGSPGVVAVAPLTTLPQPNQAPVANTYVYHSVIDEIVPFGPTQALVQAWCAAGAPIEFWASPTGEHAALEETGLPTAITYFTSRFAGLATVVPPTSTTCNIAGGVTTARKTRRQFGG